MGHLEFNRCMHEGFFSSLKDLQNGRYAVLEKLCEGGKGIVYKARDTVRARQKKLVGLNFSPPIH